MTKSIAHRGDWTAHPENTLEAFAAAVKNGADMLELDVKLTRDGHAIVVHDETLTRIWGDARAVKDVTWEEIQGIQVDGYRIPSFEEVIQTVRVPYMVDFAAFETADAIVDVLGRQSHIDRFLVVTGHIAAIARVKERLPRVTTGLTWDKIRRPRYELLQELKVSYFNPYFRFLRASVVEDMHQHGFRVSCWTVDAESDMRRLTRMGVDAIVSNKVSTLVNVVRSNNAAASQ